MKLDLTSLPVFISSCDSPKFQERRDKLLPVLDKLGFNIKEIVKGVPMPNHMYGAFLNMNKIIKRNRSPFIVLEDDCCLNEENYQPVIEIPDNTDILYLGGSAHASLQYVPEKGVLLNNAYGFNNSRVAYMPINKDYVRLFSMYSGHAILYVTEKGRNAFLYHMNIYTKIAFDMAFSLAMPKINVMMPRKTFFFQDDGYNDAFTKQIIYDHEGEIVNLNDLKAFSPYTYPIRKRGMFGTIGEPEKKVTKRVKKEVNPTEEKPKKTTRKKTKE